MTTPTIFKYISRELLKNFILSIAFLNSLLTVNSLFALSKKFMDVGLSIADTSKIIFLLQPKLLLFTVPIALLVSVLLAYGRLNMDNELIVLRASGMSLINISKPVFTFGTACFIFSLLISVYIVPVSVSHLKKEASHIMFSRLSQSIREGLFNTFFKSLTIMPNKKISDNTFEGLFIYDGRKENPMVIWANHASIAQKDDLSGIIIVMSDGSIYINRENSLTDISFGKYSLSLNFEIPGLQKDFNEIPVKDLFQKAKTDKNINAWLEFHNRFALPAASLILMLIGPTLFPMAGKTGRIGGLSIGLFTCAFFYILTIYLNNMAKAEKIHHFIGGWGASVLLGGIAVSLFYRSYKK
jgi:lipopolysaccharide export system permease protein